jgi:hypothetical protein
MPEKLLLIAATRNEDNLNWNMAIENNTAVKNNNNWNWINNNKKKNRSSQGYNNKPNYINMTIFLSLKHHNSETKIKQIIIATRRTWILIIDSS